MNYKDEKIRGVWLESNNTAHDVVKLISNMDLKSVENSSCRNPADKEMSRTDLKTCKTKLMPEFESSKIIHFFNITYKYKPGTLSKCLWYFISFTNIITADINIDNEGTDLEFSSFDALIMIFSTYLLLQSFEKEKPLLAVIWMITFFWSIYTCQYLSLVQLIRTNSYTEDEISPLMWSAFGALLLCLGLRFILWIKILDFLFGTEFIRHSIYWVEVIGYMSKKITAVKTMAPKNIS